MVLADPVLLAARTGVGGISPSCAMPHNVNHNNQRHGGQVFNATDQTKANTIPTKWKGLPEPFTAGGEGRNIPNETGAFLLFGHHYGVCSFGAKASPSLSAPCQATLQSQRARCLVFAVRCALGRSGRRVRTSFMDPGQIGRLLRRRSSEGYSIELHPHRLRSGDAEAQVP